MKRIGSGSICGNKHAENSDHFGVREFSDCCLIVVADGGSSRPFSGSFARWIVRRLMSDEFTKSNFEDYLSRLHFAFQAEYEDFPEMFASGVCIAMVFVSSPQATGYWAGDSAIYHTSFNRAPETTQVSDPFVAGPGVVKKCFEGSGPFRADKRQFDLHSGDVISVVSDGVIFDGVGDLTQRLREVNNMQKLVDEILAESHCGPMSDDATMVCYAHS